MTLPSQFSLEEENFYKDIQDLVKNGSQNEKELSLFLQRYMDLLAKADFDDETFIINFTKAGLIIEASAKVYGTKVDRLWMNLENVLESIKNKNQSQYKKKLDCEDGDELDADGIGDDEDGRRKLPLCKRRKKMGDVLFSIDDFLEIDNVSGLLGKNMNESNNNKETKLKFCEKVPNMFIKNKRKTKKIDVCLNKCAEDKDVIRLRDWITSTEGLLIKEIYIPLPESIVNSASVFESNETKNGHYNEEAVECDDNSMFERSGTKSMQESPKISENLKDEKNNNTEMVVDLKQDLRETTLNEKTAHTEEKNDFISDLNVSRESDLAKFPNILDRLSKDYLVDIDDVFWSSSKFHDVIPSKKMRAGKTNKLPCQLCAARKVHKRRGKRCFEEKKLESLDSYFIPHVQPIVSEPQFGILPDEDLYNVFKTEMKLIEQLGKINACKNINEAYHPDESPEELRNFLGFDGFEHCLIKRTTGLQGEEEEEEEVEEEEIIEMCEENLRFDHVEDGNENYREDLPVDNGFELPFPVTEHTIRTSITIRENNLETKDDEHLAHSELEYRKLVIEELKDHYAAKTSFAKNKELGIKISKWHEMIAEKIKLLQKRVALNMNSFAGIIMKSFPLSIDNTRPAITFKDLVRKQNKWDVPRYFFACLQLTNEGNLDISKSNSQPLATDCMIITQVSPSRANYKLDGCTIKSPSKEMNKTLMVEIQRKRKTVSHSASLSESKGLSKNKKVKQKIVKSHKRPKNFNSVKSSKRRRCSITSTDTFSL